MCYIYERLINIKSWKALQSMARNTCFCVWSCFVSQSLIHVRLFETPWNAARQASLSITISWSFLKPMSIESVMPSNHLILCHTLLLLPYMESG